MVRTLSVLVEEADKTEMYQEFQVERILNWGFTGRDEAAVREHVEELEAEGITAPDEIPTAYPKPHHLITSDDKIEVPSGETSGEAEFVLLPGQDETFVGVGSDHTDRGLEEESIVLSKTVCPNVTSESVWRFSDVEDHWDDIELRSFTSRDPDRTPYQTATLDSIRPPEELLDLTEDWITEPVTGTAIFSGSVGTETETLTYSDYFEATLYDPVLDRSLTAAYEVRDLDWVA